MVEMETPNPQLYYKCPPQLLVCIVKSNKKATQTESEGLRRVQYTEI